MRLVHNSTTIFYNILSIILIQCYNISNTNNETNKMYDYVIIK